MIAPEILHAQWAEARDRLVAKGLLAGKGASLSVRVPGGSAMWLGGVEDTMPVLVDWSGKPANDVTAIHAIVYEERGDVGAVALGGGAFGACLADFGGAMPQVFDEQARHIGPMPPAVRRRVELRSVLSTGGNAVLWRGVPLCFGTTSRRLALNVELFEKCAKAYVLAVAAGGRVNALPWWVRRIANGRLVKDERRAAEAFARGEQPKESSAY